LSEIFYLDITGKDEEQRHKATPQVAGQTKDDAYDLFMREMEDFL